MTGPTDQTPQEDAALAGEYALGLLTPDETRAVERRMAGDRAFAALVEDWQDRLATMAEAEVTPVPPPDRVFSALHKTLFAEQERPWWQKLGIGQAVLGALAAALVLMAALNFGWLAPDMPLRPSHLAEIEAEDQSLAITAAFVPEENAFFVEQRRGGALPGRALELWLIPPGAAPVSLGVLPAGQDLARLPLPAALAEGLRGATLAVSDEPPGGSPTGAPTGAVLAAGPITRL